MDRIDSESSNGDFVPIERLRRQPAAPPVLDKERLAALGEQLDRFAEQLSAEEHAVLTAMLNLGSRDPDLFRLGATPPEAILAPQELEVLERLQAEPAFSYLGLRSPLAIIMKGTKRCNLRCTYCRSWSDDPNQVMPFEVLARTTREALAASDIGVVEFIWHGGETTLRPISFYRKALWLQQRFRRAGQKVTNSLQTNGTNLNASWLEFLHLYHFSVGVSLDGPPELHDRRRFDTKGRPTSHRVREGLQKLQAYDISHGVLMVVDEDVLALGAERLLSYFLKIGIRQVALLNVIPEGEPDRKEPGDHLLFPRYIEFLRELFHLWWPTYSKQISFREISDLLKRLQGKRGNFCVFEENCMGGVLTVEPTGDILVCDKYQGDSSYRLGSILDGGLAALASSTELIQAHTKTDKDMSFAQSCPWFHLCHGGCPHDRYVRTRRQITHNERCCGWAPLLSDMAQALRSSVTGPLE